MSTSLERDVPPQAFSRRKTPPVNELSPPITPPQSPPPAARIDERYEEPADIDIPDNYVQHTLKTVPALPPITLKNVFSEIEWISFLAVTVTPAVGIYGMFTTHLQWKTGLFAVFWYFVTGYVDVAYVYRVVDS